MSYVTGNTIRTLRIKHGITQKELAEKLNVSDKTISKWETEKGLPDISIVEELAKALHVSLTELFTGDLKTNENVSGNIKRIQFYVCPICGNIITAVGEGNFSCCGITLLKQEAETAEEEHSLFVETVDNEFSIVMKHSMSKGHYVQSPYLRINAGNYIRSTECDMCQQHSQIPFSKSQRREQEHQTDCSYDLRIQNRYIINIQKQFLDYLL